MATVILAEKPDQARSYMKGLGIPFKGKAHSATGETFLDPITTVVSARGHLFELEEPEHYGAKYQDRTDLSALPIFPKQFDYKLRDDCGPVFAEIRKAVSTADTVIVATDNDNEGSAIAYNILRFCPGGLKKNLKRVYPAALDEKAVQKLFKNPYPIAETWRQAKAAIARAKSDWLIGMNISRLVTEKCRLSGIRGNFAAGRVLSTLLNLCVTYDDARTNFVEEPIYQLKAKTKLANVEVPLNSKVRYVGEKGKDEYFSYLKEHGLTQSKMMGKLEVLENQPKFGWPTPPFTKGSLYAEMARVAGWKKEKTVKVMQANYDQGYQTYPRTDSSKIDAEQYEYIYQNYENYIQAIKLSTNLNKVHMPEKVLKRYLAPKGQEAAHFGIIPTEKIMTPTSDVTDDQRLMYEVVVRRAISLVVDPYKYVSTKIGVLANDVPLTASIPHVLSQGWKEFILPSKKKGRSSKAKKESEIPDNIDFTKYAKVGDQVPLLLIHDQSVTKPAPPLKSIDIFDKGGLMEKAYKYVENEKYANVLKQANGIGTSATRDKAIASLEQKEYITTDKDDYVHITGNGRIMNYICKDLDFSNALLTAEWEEKYQEIGKGTIQSDQLVDETEEMILKSMKAITDNWDEKAILASYKEEQQKADEENSLGNCPKCGSGVVTKITFMSKKLGRQLTIYRCNNEDCDFIIFQDIGNGKFTDKDVKNMLMGKDSRVLKLTSKAGKKYETAFHLEEDETGKWKVAFTKSAPPKQGNPVAECPSCKMGKVTPITFNSKKLKREITVYKCDNKECDFIIFQEIGDGKFNDTDIKSMIDGHDSRKLKLTSKKGYKYEASFHLEQDETGKWKVKLTKDPDWGKKKTEFTQGNSVGRCVACGRGEVCPVSFFSKKHNKQMTMYKCTNKDCDFVIFQDFFGNKISDEDMEHMLNGGQSRKFKLTSKQGNPYEASFKLAQIEDSGKWHLKMVVDPSWDNKSDQSRKNFYKSKSKNYKKKW